MAKINRLWCCTGCGNTQYKWTGSCSVCKEWNTYVEEVAVPSSGKRFEGQSEKSSHPVRVKEVDTTESKRIQTGIQELDRLMGGGIVPGSLTLIGGNPGIGKSTLMLQISERLAQQGLTVLYICGEESVEQTSLRAERLGVQSDNLYLLSETLFSQIKLHIDQLKPDILIVDSIQIMYKQEIPSSPGSVTQVREITTEFMHLSKGMGISTFLIGHVTKSGEIAGPRVLEHMVDTVLDFDGDQQHGYRMLRGIKNRFGPTDDLALFQMTSSGLSEVRNPSLLFLEERMQKRSGSAIVPTIEGSRAFLVEMQALVAPSAYSNSTRKSTGLNPNRLALLLAVLEKRMGYQLHNKDVFVSIAGGLKITEPAIDLAVVMAISSSFSNRVLDPKTVVIGEVGLGGEVRSVSRIESRIKEAINMGFSRCILPKRNCEGLPKELAEKIELVGIVFVEEAMGSLATV
ncbi:MAG: DNA repair protein RadA [Chlamydiae bacterium]|nr:DNA repair protein RadA [Chlamydiota bacterium]